VFRMIDGINIANEIPTTSNTAATFFFRSSIQIILFDSERVASSMYVSHSSSLNVSSFQTVHPVSLRAVRRPARLSHAVYRARQALDDPS
jgi:hypothetical protein